jgi:hypothetical protein
MFVNRRIPELIRFTANCITLIARLIRAQGNRSCYSVTALGHDFNARGRALEEQKCGIASTRHVSARLIASPQQPGQSRRRAIGIDAM